jgi:type I restriction-modification system DNA methylase subunit
MARRAWEYVQQIDARSRDGEVYPAGVAAIVEQLGEVGDLARRAAPDSDAKPREVEGISRAATLGEIQDRDYSLNPATYVDSPPPTGPGTPSVSGLPDLVAELDDLESQAAEIDAKVSGLMRRLGPWTR